VDVDDETPGFVVAVVKAILDTVPDSTPGVPLNYYGAKKCKWTSQRRSLILLVLSRLEAMLTVDCSQLSAVELVQRGIRDAVYTFIKDEPHKREKLDKNRLRIISGVSLVDNIIERVLFAKQNKLEIKLNAHGPFKPGMGLHDAGQQALFAWFKKCEKRFQLCSTDVSAWDWSLPEWLINMERDYRKGVTTKHGAYARCLDVYYYGICRKVFQIPSGELFAQQVPGIQASGCYNTSSGNSHMRHMLATLVQLSLGVVATGAGEGCQMGDDALERFIPGMEEAYRNFGFTVKGVSVMPRGNFSFCSTAWSDDWRGKPESWQKTLFRFLFKNPADPLYATYQEQLRRDLRYHEGEDLWERLAVYVAHAQGQ
jgi:hypothetical protein